MLKKITLILLTLILAMSVPMNTLAEQTADKQPSYIVLRIEGPADLKIERNGESISTQEHPLGVLNDFGRIDLLSYENGRYMFCVDYFEDYTITITAKEKGTLDYTIRWFDANDEIIDEQYAKIDLEEKTIVNTSTQYSKEVPMNMDLDGDGNYDDSFFVEDRNPATIENVEFKKKTIYMRVGQKEYLDLKFKPKNPTINSVTIDSSEIEIVSFEDDYMVANKLGSSVITFNADGIIAECEVFVVDKSDTELFLLNNPWVIPTVIAGIVVISIGIILLIIVIKKKRKKKLETEDIETEE